MRYVKYFIAAITMAVVLSGCSTKIERYNRRQDQDQGQQPQTTFQLRENKTWSISYSREHLQSGEIKEKITVNSIPSSQKYLVSVINRANYSTYEGDVEKFLRNELRYNSEFVYSGAPTIIDFNRFRHGTWYAFVIGLDADKNLTGEFAYKAFEVEEETPTQEYLAWTGNWKVTSGNTTYNITVSQEEANLVYKVEGWEIREGVSGWYQMDRDDWIEADYEASNGNMYFFSQYVQNDDIIVEKKNMDEFFMGQIDYAGIFESQGLYVVPDEGMDLAAAQFTGDSNHADILPCEVKNLSVGKDTFTGPFYCMQYFYTDGNGWYAYNESVAPFPFKMERKMEAVNTPFKLRKNAVRRTGADRPMRGKLYSPRSR